MIFVPIEFVAKNFPLSAIKETFKGPAQATSSTLFFTCEMRLINLLIVLTLFLTIVPLNEPCWAFFDDDDDDDHHDHDDDDDDDDHYRRRRRYQHGVHQCIDIQHHRYDIDLRMIAFTPKRFLLLTEDMGIVDEPRGNVATNGDLEIVVDANTKPMSQDHAYIDQSQERASMRGIDKNVYTLFDGEGEYLCMSAEERHHAHVRGMVADLDKQQVHPGLQLWDRREQKFLSTDQDPLTFYVVYDEHRRMEMAKYKLTTATMAEYLSRAEGKDLNDDERRELIALDGQWTEICQGANHDEVVFLAQNHGGHCGRLHWEIERGFVRESKFVVFDDEWVIIFDVQAFTNPGQNVHFDKIHFSQYFKCSERISKLSMKNYGIMYGKLFRSY